MMTPDEILAKLVAGDPLSGQEQVYATFVMVRAMYTRDTQRIERLRVVAREAEKLTQRFEFSDDTWTMMDLNNALDALQPNDL